MNGMDSIGLIASRALSQCRIHSTRDTQQQQKEAAKARLAGTAHHLHPFSVFPKLPPDSFVRAEQEPKNERHFEH